MIKNMMTVSAIIDSSSMLSTEILFSYRVIWMELQHFIAQIGQKALKFYTD